MGKNGLDRPGTKGYAPTKKVTGFSPMGGKEDWEVIDTGDKDDGKEGMVGFPWLLP